MFCASFPGFPYELRVFFFFNTRVSSPSWFVVETRVGPAFNAHAKHATMWATGGGGSPATDGHPSRSRPPTPPPITITLPPYVGGARRRPWHLCEDRNDSPRKKSHNTHTIPCLPVRRSVARRFEPFRRATFPIRFCLVVCDHVRRSTIAFVGHNRRGKDTNGVRP